MFDASCLGILVVCLGESKRALPKVTKQHSIALETVPICSLSQFRTIARIGPVPTIMAQMLFVDILMGATLCCIIHLDKRAKNRYRAKLYLSIFDPTTQSEIGLSILLLAVQRAVLRGVTDGRLNNRGHR